MKMQLKMQVSDTAPFKRLMQNYGILINGNNALVHSISVSLEPKFTSITLAISLPLEPNYDTAKESGLSVLIPLQFSDVSHVKLTGLKLGQAKGSFQLETRGGKGTCTFDLGGENRFDFGHLMIGKTSTITMRPEISIE